MKKLSVFTFAVVIGLSQLASAQTVQPGTQNTTQVQASSANTQNKDFNLSIGKPEVVADCMWGARNIYNTWIANGASESQASSALNDYWNNCNCAAGSKAHCL